MSKKNFNRGMEAGVRPFKDKFRSMDSKIEAMEKEFSNGLDREYEAQDAINQNFNKRLSNIEKKEYYRLNTPYDIKDEDVLDTSEQEFLVAYLFTVASIMGRNENQKKFIRSVKKLSGNRECFRSGSC